VVRYHAQFLRATPDWLQGRVNASISFVIWGVTAFGAMLGGVLGEFIGLRAMMLIAAIGVSASIV
jgi:hypothetical protein